MQNIDFIITSKTREMPESSGYTSMTTVDQITIKNFPDMTKPMSQQELNDAWLLLSHIQQAAAQMKVGSWTLQRGN